MCRMHSLLIVDDHAPFRALVRTLLERDGFHVVGEAHDGESALVAAQTLRPDVVLLDVQLGPDDGFAVCEQILARADAPVVVLTSGRAIGSYRRRLALSRARGFIPKTELTSGALTALLELE
jgi:DNA-binding NarL/FixJ family response regulator